MSVAVLMKTREGESIWAQKMGQPKLAWSWVALWLHPLWVWQMVTIETHVEIMLIGRNDSDSSPYFEEPPLLLSLVIPKYPHTHTETQLR